MPTQRRTRGRLPQSRRRKRSAPVARKGWQYHKSSISRTGRQYRANSRAIRRYVRRPRRRSAIFGLLTLGVAATAFTLTAVGSLSQIAAFELGLAAEGMALGTAWLIGENKDGATGASRAKAKAKAIKTHAALCGAPTDDGTPCKRRGNCPHHKGGGSAGSGTGARKRLGSPKSKPRRQTATTATKP